MFDWQFQTYQIRKTVDFAEMETQFSMKHKILQNSRFQIHPGGGTRFPVEKHEDESGAWQQRVKLPNRSNASKFTSLSEFCK